jgi:hypothetical protein
MFFINPFIYAGGGDFESIATVTVGSGGASSIEFTSIPGTYQHLQVRYIVRSVRASNVRDNMILRVGNGSIDTGNNYAYHFLQGLGSSAGVGAGSSIGYALLAYAPASSATASIFGAGVVDILDYANTSKTKVTRAIGGVDGNGDQYLGIDVSSGLWNNTSAIDAVRIYAFNANLAQHSTAALYGIKAP